MGRKNLAQKFKMHASQPSFDALALQMVKTSVEAIKPQPPRSYSVSGVLHCYRDTSLTDAIKNLVEQGISSMPIVTRYRYKFFYGFVDLLDLVQYVARTFNDAHLANFEEFSRAYQLENINSWRRATVADLPSSRQEQPVLKGFSFFHAFEILARTGVERVCVVGSDQTIQSVITQSTALKFVHDYKDLFAAAARMMPVSHIPTNQLAPLAIGQDQRPITAFRWMSDYQCEGLGVTDESGKLVDEISSRDLRGMGWDADSFWRLYSTIRLYKSSIREKWPQHPRPVTVTLNQTLLDCIDLIVTQKAHRLFVVNAAGAPIKVITQGDLLKCLIQFEKPEAS